MMYDTATFDELKDRKVQPQLELFDVTLKGFLQVFWKLLMARVTDKAKHDKKAIDSIHQNRCDNSGETNDCKQAASKKSQHDEKSSVLQLLTKCEQIYCVKVCKFKVQPFKNNQDMPEVKNRKGRGLQTIPKGPKISRQEGAERR